VDVDACDGDASDAFGSLEGVVVGAEPFVAFAGETFAWIVIVGELGVEWVAGKPIG
jgi:hypothetical protein